MKQTRNRKRPALSFQDRLKRFAAQAREAADHLPPGAERDRLAEQLRTVEAAHPVEGPVRVEIADAADGSVMATVTP